MPPDEHGIRIRIPVHSLLQVLGQVLLMRGVLNDRNPQCVMVAQVALLGGAPGKALDLLDVVDLKDLVKARALGLEEQSDEDSPLRVRMDATAGVATREGGQEEGRALRRLVARRRTEVAALFEGRLLGGEGEHVYVCVFHEFLLDARGRDVDEVSGLALIVSMT